MEWIGNQTQDTHRRRKRRKEKDISTHLSQFFGTVPFGLDFVHAIACGRGVGKAASVVVKIVDIVGQIFLPQLLHQFPLLSFSALVTLLW